MQLFLLKISIICFCLQIFFYTFMYTSNHLIAEIHVCYSVAATCVCNQSKKERLFMLIYHPTESSNFFIQDHESTDLNGYNIKTHLHVVNGTR
jgi:hypothetical protein